jgi:hypothetical protein
MRRLFSALALGLMFAIAAGAQEDGGATERALLTGLKPLTNIEFCPQVFDGSFGGKLPTQDALRAVAASKLKEGGVKFAFSDKHNETVVDKRIRDARKNTGWMHLKVQVIVSADGKAYGCRIVLQVQSPVVHPADPRAYVFANLYEDSLLIVSTPEAAGSAVENGMSEVFGRFCDRWKRAHS